MASERRNGDLPIGYRDSARTRDHDLLDYEEILRDEPERGAPEDFPTPSESAPAVRLTNALILNALKKGASSIQLDPPADSTSARFRIAGRWHEEVVLPAGTAAEIGRRLRIMSGMPPHEPGPSMGHIFIQLGDDPADSVQLILLARPAQLGDRLLVRFVSDAERARLTWTEHEGTAEVETKLRWEHERVSRLARVAGSEASETAARAFLATAEASLPGAYRLVLEARMLLSDIAEARGDREAAIDELARGIALAERLGAPAMSTSVLLERLAELHELHDDLAAAIAARRRAVTLVSETLDPDDPYVCGVHGRLASTLDAAGQHDEARTSYDEAIRILSELTGDDDLELRDLVGARARVGLTE